MFVLGADLATWANLAVAGGTFALAVATFRLATSAKEQAASAAKQATSAAEQAQASVDQAVATAEMVDVARSQLDASGTPHLQIDRPESGTIGQDYFVVYVSNTGHAEARLTSASATNAIFDPGGMAVAARTRGQTLRFPLTGAMPPGIEFELVISYESASARRKLRAALVLKDDGRIVVRKQQTIDL